MNAILEGTCFIDRGVFNRSGTPAYSKRMSKVRSSPYVDSVMKCVLHEQGFHEIKIDPANLYDPDEMYRALRRYDHNGICVAEDSSLKKAWDDALAAFGKPCSTTYLPLVKDGELLHAIKGSKSAGLGYVGSKEENFPNGLRRSYDVLSHLKAPNPCTAFTRTSAGGKTRLVWGYPLDVTLLEARFARPLIDHYLRISTPMAFGLPKIVLGSLLKHRVCKRKYVYALDFSKFDATILEYFIRKAFDILSTWFERKDRYQFGWHRVVDYFVKTPIVMPDGHLYVGKSRGIPSGSFFTQMIGSIVNFVVLKSVFYRLGSSISTHRILVLGDDSIFSCDENIPLDVLKKEFERYGMVLNTEKSRRQDLHFLGANWESGLPDISLEKLLAKAICPERPRTHLYVSSQDSYTRWLIARGILANYASTYLSGWRAYIRKGQNLWDQDCFKFEVVENDSLLSGLERAKAASDPKYFEKLRRSRTPLSVRLLK